MARWIKINKKVNTNEVAVLLELIDTAQANPNTAPMELLQFFEEIVLDQDGWDELQETYNDMVESDKFLSDDALFDLEEERERKLKVAWDHWHKRTGTV